VGNGLFDQMKTNFKEQKDNSVDYLVNSGTKEAIKILKNVSETIQKEEDIETTVGFNAGIFFVSFTHSTHSRNKHT